MLAVRRNALRERVDAAIAQAEKLAATLDDVVVACERLKWKGTSQERRRLIKYLVHIGFERSTIETVLSSEIT